MLSGQSLRMTAEWHLTVLEKLSQPELSLPENLGFAWLTVHDVCMLLALTRGGACDQTRDWKTPLNEAMLKARPSHLIAEGVLLGRLHHARALLAMHGVCVLLAKEGASTRWHCRPGGRTW